MKAISKILAVAALVTCATSVSAHAFTKHSPGRTYEVIAKCLKDDFAMKEGIDFRKNPVTKSIQLSDGALSGDFRGRESEIDECFHPTAESKDEK